MSLALLCYPSLQWHNPSVREIHANTKKNISLSQSLLFLPPEGLDGETFSALLRSLMPLILAILSPPESTTTTSDEVAFPVVRFTVYNELDATAQTASSGLGYDPISWNLVGTHTIEAYSWFTNDLVNPDFAPLATTLELDEDSWGTIACVCLLASTTSGVNIFS